MPNNISVNYLAYVPYGIIHLQAFLHSYKKYPAGASHTLTIIFKGMNEEDELKPFIEIADAADITYKILYYKEAGFDIDTYFWAAQQLDGRILLFFNTQSQILYDNWLGNYINNLTDVTGIISATASYQSYYSSVFKKNKFTWETKESAKYNFRKYKLFLKAFFYWRFLFKPFPNTHIRTNAFMIKRELFLKLKHKLLTSKFKAYQFESGRNSMTTQILKMGYKVLVIDKEGITYEPKDWKLSKTFWCGEQEGLLVSDNQTRIYEQASAEEKKVMTKLAWG